MAAITEPITTATRQHIPGRRFTDPRVQALLLPTVRVPPSARSFTNRDLRSYLRPTRAIPEHRTSGQITYDLRRLRSHGLIERVSRPTDINSPTKLHNARSPAPTNRLLRTGLAESHGPTHHPNSASPPEPTKPAIANLTRTAGLAA